MTEKISRPILRYHGGKWKLAPWLLTFFPAHRTYVVRMRRANFHVGGPDFWEANR